VLKHSEADVIAIQECYEDAHFQEIYEPLQALYPFYAREKSRTKLLQCDNGLAILSKWKIESSEIERLRKVSTLEKYMASKSNLNVVIQVPQLGSVSMVNTHTTAGGATHPENTDVDTDREDELNQALAYCKNATDNCSHAIILGDLNCGPEASKANYEHCINAGYRDTFLDGQHEGLKYQQTWDPRNYLNQIGPHSHCPAQRCDHVFISPSLANIVDNDSTKADILFTEEVVPIRTKKGQVMSTLSDHFGLAITLRLK
jgi:endonuclease/exonuclease/phosphatase family metal-dependent hydrolase